MGINRRRDPRYHARIRAAIVRGQEADWRHTDNVSYRGAYILTATPPPVRTLIEVRFVLPPHDDRVTFHAMVAYSATPEVRPKAPGIGVQLYGVAGTDGTRWQQFIRRLRQDHPETLDPSTPIDYLGPSCAEGPNRLGARHDGKIRLRLGSVRELRALFDTNITRGAVLIPSEASHEPGDPLEIEIVHPTTGERFSFFGAVRRNVRRDDFGGVAVELLDTQPPRLAAFRVFIDGGAAEQVAP